MTTLTDVTEEQKNGEKSLNKTRQQIVFIKEKLIRLENKLNTVINILTKNNSERQQHSWL